MSLTERIKARRPATQEELAAAYEAWRAADREYFTVRWLQRLQPKDMTKAVLA